MNTSRVLVSVALLLGWLSTIGHGEDAQHVVIDKKPVEVERKTFDPKNRPADMPKLRPGEDAVTRYQFSCASSVAYNTRTEEEPGGDGNNCKATATLEKLTLTLGLKVVIWLPTNTTPKLRAHEEGHREIAEMYYGDADTVARKIAEPIANEEYTASGPNCEDKVKSTIDAAIKTIGEQWTAAVIEPANRVEDIYDELTDHGRNMKLAEKDAIKMAVERYQKETLRKED